MGKSEREEGGEEIGGGAKGLKRSFELIGSLRCDKKQLHYKGQILHEVILYRPGGYFKVK